MRSGEKTAPSSKHDVRSKGRIRDSGPQPSVSFRQATAVLVEDDIGGERMATASTRGDSAIAYSGNTLGLFFKTSSPALFLTNPLLCPTSTERRAADVIRTDEY